MIRKYARTDCVNEIQRKQISFIINSFRSSDKQKVIFNLFGQSGVGKSYLCKSLYLNENIFKADQEVLIDLNQISNNNIPGIIQVITDKLGIMRFKSTLNQLDRYFRSIDASKTDILEQCINDFINELNTYANNVGGILLIFDTFEALNVKTEQSQFKQILNFTNEKVHFLIAGINKLDYNNSVSCRLTGFDEEEIKKYLISRNCNMRQVFEKKGDLFASRIKNYTDGGNPILCGLVSDWLCSYMDIQTQMEYLISETNTKKHLINWINDLDANMRLTLRITAFFNERMTVELLSSLSGMDVNLASECLNDIVNFSFVKTYSDVFDSEPQIILHDVVAKLIREFIPFSMEELQAFVKKALSVYEKKILEDRLNVDGFKLEQSLKVERVMLAIRNGCFEDAFVLFDDEILDGIDYYNYSFVDQLINHVDSYIKTEKGCYPNDANEYRERWGYIIQVAKAEEELSRYQAKKAVELYQELKKCALYCQSDLYRALADGVYARALVNPCTYECENALSIAIKLLKDSQKVITKTNLSRRIVKLCYWLGNAYVRSGQNEKAQSAYDEAIKMSKTDLQKVTILLDKSKMIRLQQDVTDALKPLNDCDVLIEGMKQKNKGKYYYYKGNVYRDLDNVVLATRYYEMAFEALNQGDDNFTLCELNLDYAWLQYIRNDIEAINVENVKKYLEKGWNLAQQYHFGSEYSEYYHILYEIFNYREEYTMAYRYLDQAIKYAYKYSNIYMELDCLNHQTQRFYREGKYEQVPIIINEMEKIENTGCKIRVFRGRAKLVQADIYFEQQHYDLALREYLDGFVIVALYGKSRSNVELFKDLLNNKTALGLSRKEKIFECLNKVSEPTKYRRNIKRTWSRNNISKEYDYFLDGLWSNNK